MGLYRDLDNLKQCNEVKKRVCMNDHYEEDIFQYLCPHCHWEVRKSFTRLCPNCHKPLAWLNVLEEVVRSNKGKRFPYPMVSNVPPPVKDLLSKCYYKSWGLYYYGDVCVAKMSRIVSSEGNVHHVVTLRPFKDIKEDLDKLLSVDILLSLHKNRRL